MGKGGWVSTSILEKECTDHRASTYDFALELINLSAKGGGELLNNENYIQDLKIDPELLSFS